MKQMTMVNLIEHSITDNFKTSKESITDSLSRPCSYSRYRTGTSLQPRLLRGIFSKANDIFLFLMIFHRVRLNCKLVPVEFREYEYGLLNYLFFSFSMLFGVLPDGTAVVFSPGAAVLSSVAT